MAANKRRRRRNKHPYVAMRPQADGSVRPRFQPGPRERALGFENEDLRHDGGRWFTHAEACAWAMAKAEEIAAARGSGRKRRAPAAAKGRSVEALWDAYTRSKTFLGAPDEGIPGLAPATQNTYQKYINPLRGEPIWQAPVTSLARDMFANEDNGLYRALVKRHGLGMAKGAMSALGAAITWGLQNGWGKRANGDVMAHPIRELGMTKPPARLRVATQLELQTLVATADSAEINLPAIGDGILLAFFSGQRKADVLALVEIGEGHNQQRMKLRQQKTGAAVSIPYAPRLAERIAQARARRRDLGLTVQAQTIVVNEATGLPYNDADFREGFNLVRAAAIKICPSLDWSTDAATGELVNKPFKFPDLRDSNVTWLARAGCDLPEIASITGHSLKSIHQILKAYLLLDEALADSAIRKLVDYMEREGLQV